MSIRVLFVCHGNICRSPMAEFILKDKVEKMGLKDQFEIASAATSTEEIWGDVGNPVYGPAKRELKAHGIGQTPYTDFSSKRARQVEKKDYRHYDLILCADQSNIRNLRSIIPSDPEQKIHLMMDYTERPGTSIADPWYTGDFSQTYQDIMESTDGLLRELGY